MTLAEQFITERKIFKNVTPATPTGTTELQNHFEGTLESKATVGQQIAELLKKNGLGAIFGQLVPAGSERLFPRAA